MPLLWCDAYLPAMVLRVAGDATFTAAVSVGSLALGRCVLGYVLSIVFGLGVPGIWLGMTGEWLFRAVVLRIRLKKSSWDRLVERRIGIVQDN